MPGVSVSHTVREGREQTLRQRGGHTVAEEHKNGGIKGEVHIRHSGRETYEQRWRKRQRDREKTPKGKARRV